MPDALAGAAGGKGHGRALGAAGELGGRGEWRLTLDGDTCHVSCDWQVQSDRPVAEAADGVKPQPGDGESPRGSAARPGPVSGLFDLAARLDPILEAAKVEDLGIAHVLQQLARQRGAAPGGAV